MTTKDWQKSSYSGDASNCLYVAAVGDSIKIRESGAPDTIITTTRENLRAFILGVKAGEFDHFAE